MIFFTLRLLNSSREGYVSIFFYFFYKLKFKVEAEGRLNPTIPSIDPRDKLIEAV